MGPLPKSVDEDVGCGEPDEEVVLERIGGVAVTVGKGMIDVEFTGI